MTPAGDPPAERALLLETQIPASGAANAQRETQSLQKKGILAV